MNTAKSTKRMLLTEPLVQLALAALAGLFLSWPILQVAGEGGATRLFVYLFSMWGGLVFLLWRIGRAIAVHQAAAADPRTDRKGAAGGQR